MELYNQHKGACKSHSEYANIQFFPEEQKDTLRRNLQPSQEKSKPY